MTQDRRRFVGGVEVFTRRYYSRDDDVSDLERAQIELVTGVPDHSRKARTPAPAVTVPAPTPAATPAPAPRVGPSAPPVSVSAVPKAVLPEKPTPAEPLPKVRKPRAVKAPPAPAPAPAPDPAAQPSRPVDVAKPSPADYEAARAAFGVPEVDGAAIADTADLRAFLIRHMKLAAAGKVSPNTAHQVCLFAEKIMQATQLELEAEKVLNLCRRDTLRVVDLIATESP